MHLLRTIAILILFGISRSSFGEVLSETIPTLGNSSSNLVSIEQERLLGQAWLRSLRRHTKSYDNPTVTEYLTNLIYKLAPSSGVIDRDFTLAILDNPNLNAFAVPGSVIGINAGLFFHTRSEQEFASVIAHELAHLSQRHYARRLEQQQLSSPLTMAAFLASVVIAATAGSDAGMAALASTQALSADSQLRFSRKNEQEADRLGLQIMSDSGFDPRAMAKMFGRLYKQSRISTENFPEFLSTHPLSESRLSDTEGLASQYPIKNFKDDIEFHICRNMIIADYAHSRETAISYFDSVIKKGNAIHLDAAKFGLAYAYIDNSPQKAIKLFGEILTEHPNLISANIYYSKALIRASKKTEAIQVLEQQLSRNPKNYSILRALAQSLLETDDIERAYRTLLTANKSYPEDPDILYLLAEVAGLAGHISQLHQARAEFFFLTSRIDQAIEQLGLALKKSSSELEQIRIQSRLDRFYEVKKNPVF
jgi:predicted Zn-dependent protease